MKRSKGKKRRIRKRILILCEGETEKNYFQAIKEDPDYKQVLSAIFPKIVTAKHPAPELVVKEAINLAEKAVRDGNAYDEVWVVFDHDNRKHLTTVYEEARKRSFSIGFTAIAFEVWYLIHFVRSTRPFSNGKELEKELGRYYPNYEKARQNDFANLKSRLREAFVNAALMRAQSHEHNKHITAYNPWTDIDVLVKQLINSNQ